MERENRQYTMKLEKGQALIRETIILLQLWEPGISSLQLTDTAVKIQWPIEELSHLFFLYTARSDMVLYDFITQVYWPKYHAGFEEIKKGDLLIFLEEAAHKGYMRNQWSDDSMERTARAILGCLTEFKLQGPENTGIRKILPFNISKNTVNYMAHEIHFSGFSDNTIMQHPDWGLFGLQSCSVLEELKSVSYDGHFIVQFSGELLNINWRYKNMAGRPGKRRIQIKLSGISWLTKADCG